MNFADWRQDWGMRWALKDAFEMLPSLINAEIFGFYSPWVEVNADIVRKRIEIKK